MNEIRIGMLLDQDFPPDSRVENEAFSLIAAGFDVCLFSLAFRKEPTDETWNGIKVRRYKADRLLFKMSALAYDFPYYHGKVSKMIGRFIEDNNITALHVHDMVLAKAAFMANRKYQLPVTLDLHENRPVIMQFYPHLKKFPGKWLINIARWEKEQNALLQKADKVVLVTEEARDEAVKSAGIAPEKVVVVPNTIHPDIFLKYATDQRVLDRFKNGYNLVYVGDTGLRRGTADVINALPAILKEIPEARLILVGKSTQDVYLKEFAVTIGVNDQVYFEGWQDVSLFPSYIQVADICLSPIHRNLHHDTTFANKLFQYMAMGKPVLASDCPPQVRVIEEASCGLIHKGGDANDIARQVVALARNKKEALAMGNRGKEAVFSKYNWNLTSRELIRHYQAVKQTAGAVGSRQ